jgi:hypothetical protein
VDGVSDALGLSAAVAWVTLLFLELALAARWSAMYFRSGVLLFRQRVVSQQSAARLEEDLNLTFEREFWSPLTFRQLPDGSVAFRERFSPFPMWLSYYIPVMHGRITPMPQGGVDVIGRSNWTAPLVGAMIMGRTLVEGGPLLAGVFGMFLSAMYAAQAMRFRQVAQVTAAAGIEAA